MPALSIPPNSSMEKLSDPPAPQNIHPVQGHPPRPSEQGSARKFGAIKMFNRPINAPHVPNEQPKSASSAMEAKICDHDMMDGMTTDVQPDPQPSLNSERMDGVDQGPSTVSPELLMFQDSAREAKIGDEMVDALPTIAQPESQPLLNSEQMNGIDQGPSIVPVSSCPLKSQDSVAEVKLGDDEMADAVPTTAQPDPQPVMGKSSDETVGAEPAAAQPDAQPLKIKIGDDEMVGAMPTAAQSDPQPMKIDHQSLATSRARLQQKLMPKFDPSKIRPPFTTTTTSKGKTGFFSIPPSKFTPPQKKDERSGAPSLSIASNTDSPFKFSPPPSPTTGGTPVLIVPEKKVENSGAPVLSMTDSTFGSAKFQAPTPAPAKSAPKRLTLEKTLKKMNAERSGQVEVHVEKGEKPLSNPPPPPTVPPKESNNLAPRFEAKSQLTPVEAKNKQKVDQTAAKPTVVPAITLTTHPTAPMVDPEPKSFHEVDMNGRVAIEQSRPNFETSNPRTTQYEVPGIANLSFMEQFKSKTSEDEKAKEAADRANDLSSTGSDDKLPPNPRAAYEFPINKIFVPSRSEQDLADEVERLRKVAADQEAELKLVKSQQVEQQEREKASQEQFAADAEQERARAHETKLALKRKVVRANKKCDTLAEYIERIERQEEALWEAIQIPLPAATVDEQAVQTDDHQADGLGERAEGDDLLTTALGQGVVEWSGPALVESLEQEAGTVAGTDPLVLVIYNGPLDAVDSIPLPATPLVEDAPVVEMTADEKATALLSLQDDNPPLEFRPRRRPQANPMSPRYGERALGLSTSRRLPSLSEFAAMNSSRSRISSPLAPAPAQPQNTIQPIKSKRFTMEEFVKEYCSRGQDGFRAWIDGMIELESGKTMVLRGQDWADAWAVTEIVVLVCDMFQTERCDFAGPVRSDLESRCHALVEQGRWKRKTEVSKLWDEIQLFTKATKAADRAYAVITRPNPRVTTLAKDLVNYETKAAYHLKRANENHGFCSTVKLMFGIVSPDGAEHFEHTKQADKIRNKLPDVLEQAASAGKEYGSAFRELIQGGRFSRALKKTLQAGSQNQWREMHMILGGVCSILDQMDLMAIGDVDNKFGGGVARKLGTNVEKDVKHISLHSHFGHYNGTAANDFVVL